jgi:hypothetical protein
LADIVSKADFARRCGVTGARVSQWLRDGMIGPEALLGRGRHARVRAEIATEMLRERLDLAHGGCATNLDGFRRPAPSEATVDDRKSKLVTAPDPSIHPYAVMRC